MKPKTRSFNNKIQAYRSFIQKEYVQNSSMQTVMRKANEILISQDNIRISYFEFLCEQSKFIKKRWWCMQAIVLILLWFLLKDSGSTEYAERILGVFASGFVILIIPEIWKNRHFSATEIERTSFYSLHQICAARTVLFAMADISMIVFFFLFSYHTVQISLYKLVINFLIPFNVSSCICFRTLYSKRISTESAAIIASIIWSVIWSAVITQDSLYDKIAEPVWLSCTLLSFGFLIYFIQKSWLVCEEAWEDFYCEKLH